MKNYLKTSKWLRWVAAGAFSLMLVLNIMVSLEFEKGKLLPSITLTELGNNAMAQGETGSSGSPHCGPLYGNQSGTLYCCGNTNSDHCYADHC
ncbi:hypothetical protein MM239_12615 [Belliella sp. DSM 111904]|uniref:Uncharacterized protein n=1 Tax=Belliella filtrata TaxID=2923435 RepID=A0ABS9V1E7_9BACT|nr:hypothetical protein [Belliella filtrata]MCH7410242.1 hypothetical protein [Belliella filtrata]